MTILVITRENDPHADLVIRELGILEMSVFRLNTETAHSYDITLTLDEGSIVHKRTERKLCLRDVSGVYMRRQEQIEASISPKDMDFVQPEWRSFYDNLWSVLNGVLWVSSTSVLRDASCKLSQLQCAKSVGFNVPDTVMTNSVDAIYDLQRNNAKTLYKPFNSGKYGDEGMIYSNVLNGSYVDIETRESLSICPGIFQGYVDKEFEVRATVVGEEVFAVRIDSQKSVSTKVDWRKYDTSDLPHYPLELSRDISEKCVSVVKMLGLRFGAVDLIVHPSGEIFFLEVNANGQWAWVEVITGYPIARSIASLFR